MAKRKTCHVAPAEMLRKEFLCQFNSEKHGKPQVKIMYFHYREKVLFV